MRNKQPDPKKNLKKKKTVKKVNKSKRTKAVNDRLRKAGLTEAEIKSVGG